MPDVGDVLLDRYELTALIGRGGFGAVYAGHDRVLGREVAIKVLEASTREDAERFLREARIVAALENERVVRLFEAGVDAAGIPFLVMERLHGVSLSAFLRSRGGRLPVAEAVDLILEACAALREAHAAGIVHRDIKPQNMFVADRRDGTRRLKVLDFGIAKWGHSPVLTGDQVTMGTLHYMAPEQILDARTADARADVWALGVVLYQMIAGCLPFAAGSDAAYAAVVLVSDPTPLTEQEPKVPTLLAAAITQCLARLPQDRHRSVLDFATAIAPFGSDAGRRSVVVPADLRSARLALAPTEDASPTVTARQTALRPEEAPSRRVFLATAAAVVVIGGGVGLFSLWPKDVKTMKAFGVRLPELQRVVDAAETDAGASSSSGPLDASAPVPARVRPPSRPSGAASKEGGAPASSEEDQSPTSYPRFVGPCMSNGRNVPGFLVQAGTLRYLCEQLAEDGCGGIAAKCATRGDEERSRCRAFLESMRREGGCS